MKFSIHHHNHISFKFCICPAELLKRLDDVAREVRLKAAQVLGVLFLNLPEGYDVKLNAARLQHLCKDALIFLDDPDQQIQEAVCGKTQVHSLLLDWNFKRKKPNCTWLNSHH